MKKLLILTLLLLLATLPALAEGVSEDGFFYAMQADDTVSISGVRGQVEDTLTIPSEIEGAPVTKIDGYTFNCRATQVFIPKTLVDIDLDGSNPFDEMPCLTEIVVEEGNPVFETINGVLFNKQENALIAYPLGRTDTSYAIPEGTRTVIRNAFYKAPLTEITFPSTLTELKREAFNGCEGLKRVELPEGLTEMGRGVFLYCFGLTEAILPESLTVIPTEAFFNCSALASVRVSSQLTEIGSSAFSRCYALESIELPTTVTTIAPDAFNGCPFQP